MAVHLKRLFIFFYAKRSTILVAGIIGSFVVLVNALIGHPNYRAELTFAVEEEKKLGGDLNSALGMASQFGIDLNMGGGMFSSDHLIALIKSRYIVDNALLSSVSVKGEELTLAQLYKKSTRRKRKDLNIEFLPNDAPPHFTLQQDSLLGVFYDEISKNNLTVDKFNKTLPIVSIKVISENQTFAKYFAEALFKTISDFYMKLKNEKEYKSINNLTIQTDSLKQVLYSSIWDKAILSDNNPNGNPFFNILDVPEKIKEVDVKIDQTVLNQLNKSLESSKITTMNNRPILHLIDKPVFPLDNEEPSNLEKALVGFVGGVFLMVCYLFAEAFLRRDII